MSTANTMSARPACSRQRHNGRSRCRLCKPLLRHHSKQRSIRLIPYADAAMPMGGASGDFPADEVKVFPRLKEKDPFKVLGIPSDSDFEEVQQARNFLVEEFRSHEASREHIELAYEKVVSQSFKSRQKRGFRPGRTKRGKKVEYEAPPTLKERIKNMIDPSATIVTLVNESVIFGLIAVWSAMTAGLNTLPTMLTFAYAAYKTFQKRNLRNPEGPYFGGSPIFGALLQAFIGMALSVALAEGLKTVVPFYMLNISDYRAGAFMVTMFMCPYNVFLK